METKHTPEPWAFESARLHGDMVKQPEFCLRIYANDPGPDRDFTIAFVRDVDPEIREAHARRIVACVNACAEITTYDLEGGIHDKRHRHEIIADLVTANKERDELAAALRDLLDVVVDGTNRGNGRAAAKARAVLAKLQS